MSLIKKIFSVFKKGENVSENAEVENVQTVDENVTTEEVKEEVAEEVAEEVVI